MAEPLDHKEVVSIEELVNSNMFQLEALIEVLAQKGIVSKEKGLNVCRPILYLLRRDIPRPK